MGDYKKKSLLNGNSGERLKSSTGDGRKRVGGKRAAGIGVFMTAWDIKKKNMERLF